VAWSAIEVNDGSKVLSPREHQIAVLVGRGLSNKDVARELGLSLSTVRMHVHNIFQKLGERSRYGLIATVLSPTVTRILLFCGCLLGNLGDEQASMYFLFG
jgi:DNA-binding NarL/FixJ family response regulator